MSADSRKNKLFRSKETGASLAEAMVAAFVLAVVMVAGSGYFFLPRQTIASQSTKRLAVAEAGNRMEFLLSLPYSSLSVDSSEVATSVALGNVSALRSTTVTLVDDAADGLGNNDADGQVVDYKKISVSVAWGSAGNRSVTLETVVGDMRYEQPVTGDFSGWGRKCELVLQAARVAGDLEDFPVLLTEDNLPAEMLDKDGFYAALSDGGDIRFSSDAEGQERLAAEIVSFQQNNDPAQATAQIWVRVPQVAAAQNTSFWVWYKKNDVTQPAAGEAYGAHAVWKDYALVLHLEEDPAGSGVQFEDMSGNGNDAAVVATPPQQGGGTVGQALSFQANDDLIRVPDDSTLDLTAQGTLEAWLWKKENLNYEGLIHKGDLKDWSDEAYSLQLWAREKFNLYLAAAHGGHNLISNTALNTETWYHLAGTWNRQQMVLYLNGAVDASRSHSIRVRQTSGGVNIGAQLLEDYSASYKNFPLSGILDEIRISRIARSAAWIQTCYNNQSAPATFVLSATPETP